MGGPLGQGDDNVTKFGREALKLITSGTLNFDERMVDYVKRNGGAFLSL